MFDGGSGKSDGEGEELGERVKRCECGVRF
jgi:hypothetical protein